MEVWVVPVARAKRPLFRQEIGLEVLYHSKGNKIRDGNKEFRQMPFYLNIK